MSGLREFHYDLHIHSCLSPCGDPDMTPCNLVRMAVLKGLDVIALTDHNSCLNCKAAVEAGVRYGLLVLPGMELCTQENIHVICLFETLPGALEFSEKVRSLLPEVPNRPDIFGDQTVMDSADTVTGHETRYLLGAAEVRFDRAARLAESFGGAAFPAHIDREAFGALGVLGVLPPDAGFSSFELSSACDRNRFLEEHPELRKSRILCNSDAHRLWEISERGNSFALPELAPRTVLEYLQSRGVR
jgi:PHP family Zn ribbon phosphoesterase